MSRRAHQLIEAVRRPVPEGTFVVGLGLMVAGVTTYGFQIVCYHALSKSAYTALNGLWVIAFVLAPGFFLPLEQEVSRALAHRRALGQGGGPVVRRAAVAGAILATSLVVVTLLVEAITTALGQSLSENFFHGEEVLLPCLLIALCTYAVQHLARGTLSGNGRFKPYAKIIGVEGVIRLVPAMVLLAIGVDGLVWYGLCFAIPPLIATLVSLRGEHGLLQPGPDAPWSELSVNLSWLFSGSLLFQLLSYSPVIGILVLANGKVERELAADFIVGFFIARIPILLFQAVQAALLPKLAGLAGSGRHADFRSGVKKLLVVVLAVGVAGVVGAATLGSFAGRHLFGDSFALDNRDLALLALGSGLFILALTLAQALIALNGHARATFAWLVGNAWFWAAVAMSSDDLFLRNEIGFAVGAGVSAAVMAWLLQRRFREEVPPGALDELVENIEHEPLEI
jgi:O-antigen/teichoic acid export membrane protein